MSEAKISRREVVRASTIVIDEMRKIKQSNEVIVLGVNEAVSQMRANVEDSTFYTSVSPPSKISWGAYELC